MILSNQDNSRPTDYKSLDKEAKNKISVLDDLQIKTIGQWINQFVNSRLIDQSIERAEN